jgi:hypothetical protein
MKLALVLITSIAACNYSLHTSGRLGPRTGGQSSASPESSESSESSGSNSARAVPSGPATWNRWEVRGLRLGMPRSAVVAQGYTCGKQPRSSCYKFLDKRCKTGKCELKHDMMNSWFVLDGVETKLDFITCDFTDSDSALVYRIYYGFAPRQLLTPESTLGKALIEKYGPTSGVDEPSQGDHQGGGRMTFGDMGHSDAPNIIADCNSPNDEPGGQCHLQVDDFTIQTVERSKQQQIDKQTRQASQPTTAPDL